MKCESCKFWEEGKDQPFGSCRRYAPRPQEKGPKEGQRPMDAVWTRTKGDDWCGEWSVKVAVDAEE